MESKAGIGTSFPVESNKDAPDGISNLGDDVILRILSQLTMKEAAATSVLSKRWKYAWVASLTRPVFEKRTFPGMDAISFAKMVNGVVHHFPEGMTLEEFWLSFCQDGSSLAKSDIDKWLDFALCSGAPRVKLSLHSQYCLSYRVPIELFNASCHGKRFTALRELFLIHVDVGDKVFEAILSTCASLECLVVVDSDELRTAKCTIPHLEVEALDN